MQPIRPTCTKDVSGSPDAVHVVLHKLDHSCINLSHSLALTSLSRSMTNCSSTTMPSSRTPKTYSNNSASTSRGRWCQTVAVLRTWLWQRRGTFWRQRWTSWGLKSRPLGSNSNAPNTPIARNLLRHFPKSGRPKSLPSRGSGVPLLHQQLLKNKKTLTFPEFTLASCTSWPPMLLEILMTLPSNRRLVVCGDDDDDDDDDILSIGKWNGLLLDFLWNQLSVNKKLW